MMLVMNALLAAWFLELEHFGCMIGSKAMGLMWHELRMSLPWWSNCPLLHEALIGDIGILVHLLRYIIMRLLTLHLLLSPIVSVKYLDLGLGAILFVIFVHSVHGIGDMVLVQMCLVLHQDYIVISGH